MKCIVCIWQVGDPHDGVTIVNGNAVCVHHLDAALAQGITRSARDLVDYVLYAMGQKAVPK